jgi:hypothetical protein
VTFERRNSAMQIHHSRAESCRVTIISLREILGATILQVEAVRIVGDGRIFPVMGDVDRPCPASPPDRP